MARCSRCIIPDTVPGISFSEGVCSFCASYKPEHNLGMDPLREVSSRSRGRGEPYDCIVPVSGGRDSAYVLYVARVVLGLNPLAVNYDNEFQTEQARVNMERACSRLGVDLLRVRSRRGIARRIVRNHIRFALPLGVLPIVEGLCTACVYGYKSAVYRAALAHRIPLIFWGESQAERTEPMLERVKNAIPVAGSRPPRAARRFLRPSYYAMYLTELAQRLEFPVPGNPKLRSGNLALRVPDIREIRLFDYLPWDRRAIKETIARELGWEKPSGSASSWRIDCRLVRFVNYCYFKSFGCSKSCFAYCNMINAGHLSRDEALRQEEELSARRMEGLEDFLSSGIGLKAREVQKILTLEA